VAKKSSLEQWFLMQEAWRPTILDEKIFAAHKASLKAHFTFKSTYLIKPNAAL
jgi:hypothetical protein